jgi:hypothetical protein
MRTNDARKSLYNRYGALSHDGIDLSNHFSKLVREFLSRHVTGQYRLHEVESILTYEVSGLLSEMRLTEGLAIRRLERESSKGE